MSKLILKALSFLVLAAVLIVAFGGFAGMMHQFGENMGNCPFSLEESLCPQDSLAVVVHQVSFYRAFFAATLKVGLLIVAALLIVTLFVLGRNFYNEVVFRPQFAFCRRSNRPPPSQYKIVRWLSLFENSPSLF